MLIDDAVQRKVEQMLLERKLCGESKIKDIATDAGREIYELFVKEMGEVKDEVQTLHDRQDRLWDQTFAPTPIRQSLWSKLLFWRR